ncbi:MAG: RecQ family ATP-dependent DNA helicase [Fimbriimonadaceae bacterium]|nr:RecQ family ATP-dependent DNA helicase [Fimbriimonadaceae bacterium]
METVAAQARPEIAELLHRYWGFESLRPLQGEVVEAAQAGKDALVVLPTGGGKSLCFQLPALLSDRLTVVVSPLISLMKDQVDSLLLLGYPAGALNSGLTAAEQREVIERVRSGQLKLLYLSPERLVSETTARLLERASEGRGVGHIAIDEAHCISHWGHDFRPEYRQLQSLRCWFPHASVHGFTATATPRVQDDIAGQLGLRDAQRFIGTFDRPNLTYRVVPKIDAYATIAEAVRRHQADAVIVYCISRKDTEQVASRLQSRGFDTRAYHAGLSDSERREVSEAFARESLGVVVATVAFGMGIDRANVRCVIHESMPKSIEAYQQETGRAGRDGLPSECLMLYSNADLMRWRRVMGDGHPDQVKHQYALLEEVRRFATGTRCRHAYLSAYFGQELPPRCEACDVCLDGQPIVPGSTRIAQKIVATVREVAQGGPRGVAHLSAVLVGADSKAVRNAGHDRLRGYGSLTGEHKEKIQAWIHQLVDQGFLAVAGDQYRVVLPTAEGIALLRADAHVELREVAAVALRPGKRRADRSGPRDADTLLQALRAERIRIADERKVAAYMVLHDSTLSAIADRCPRDLAELARIPGIGERKLADLGDRILAVVASRSGDLRSRAAQAAPLFAASEPIESVAHALRVVPSTAVGYLVDWIKEASPSSVSPWVDAATYARVLDTAERVGGRLLKPIKEELDDVPYDTIRIVLAHATKLGRLAVTVAPEHES